MNYNELSLHQIMPKKLTAEIMVPSLIQERLQMWGRCIHAQRVRQRVTASNLAERMGVSRATVQRLERGDTGASVSAYLTALLILGVVDEAAPTLDPALWLTAPRQRVRANQAERAGGPHGDYF